MDQRAELDLKWKEKSNPNEKCVRKLENIEAYLTPRTGRKRKAERIHKSSQGDSGV